MLIVIINYETSGATDGVTKGLVNISTIGWFWGGLYKNSIIS